MGMGVFNPTNSDESPERPSRKRRVKREVNNDRDYIKVGFFPITIDLIETIQTIRATHSKKPSTSYIVYLLLLISRFNFSIGKAFCLSDSKIGQLLNMSSRNVQRARKEWAGWLTVRERKIIQGESEKDSGKTTEYLKLECPGLDSESKARAGFSYLGMQRSTFETFLLRNKKATSRHIIAFIALRYLEWRGREKRAKPRTGFVIRKDELQTLSQALSGIDNAPKLIMELSRILATDGKPLFGATDKYHKLEIAGLRDIPGPPTRPRSLVGGSQKSGD